jgi:hypothetical protein
VDGRLARFGGIVVGDRLIFLVRLHERGLIAYGEPWSTAGDGTGRGGRVDPELAALASEAASTVVKALTTTAWEQAKKAIGSLWRRAHPNRAETIEDEVTEAHEQLVAAQQAGDDQSEQDLVIEWQSRLRRLLAADPSLADELRQWVEGLRAALPDAGKAEIGRLEMHARASGQGRVYQAGRDQHITES